MPSSRRAPARKPRTSASTITEDLDRFDTGGEKWDLIALIYMHGWFHETRLNPPQRLSEALRLGGLLVIESYAGGQGDFQTNELLRVFRNLKIVHYEDVRDEADSAPARKSRLVRFIAEKPAGN